MFFNLQTMVIMFEKGKGKGPHFNSRKEITPLKWIISSFVSHTQYFKKVYKYFQVTFCASQTHLTWWKWEKKANL